MSTKSLTKITNFRFIFWIAAIACLSQFVQITAQTSRVNGALLGTVVDSSGAVVPGAAVQIHNTDTGHSRTLESDANGQFQIRELPSGVYRLSITREGFAPYANPAIVVSVGSVSNLTLKLSPAGVSRQLTVTDQPAVIDPTQTAISTTIDPDRIEELPVVAAHSS